MTPTRCALVGVVVTLLLVVSGPPRLVFAGQPSDPSPEAHRAVLDRYCVTCHSERIVNGSGTAPSPLIGQLRAVGLALDTLDLERIGDHAAVWEQVVRKLRGGMMPPAGRPRPDPDAERALLAWLEDELGRAAAARPNPGRTTSFHRLNRVEYRNAVRDLLALDIDVAELLPADDSSRGFDNVGDALRLSQSLMERYLAAARTVSRWAVGSPPPAVVSHTYRIATDMQQHDRVEALPFGTRGGTLVSHLFPQDAEYALQVELDRATGGRLPQRLEVTVDGDEVALVALGAGAEPPPNLDSGTLTVRVPVAAGPHDIGVTFYRNSASLVEQARDPFQNPRLGVCAAETQRRRAPVCSPAIDH
ncbi:MAG: DUF1587 domain-containing protein, partial [Acidobacteria bacterium]|nr:DUF1587 domain-containing protein [Acidobacteriota bacterium]